MQIDKYPTIAEITVATAHAGTADACSGALATSFNSNTTAPKTAGIDIIKEYFTANFFSKPQSRQAVIVVPERDSPGIVAIPCATPINPALTYDASLGRFVPSSA